MTKNLTVSDKTHKRIKKEAPYLLQYPYYAGKQGLKDLNDLRHRLISMPYWRQKNDPAFKPYFEIQNIMEETKKKTSVNINKIAEFVDQHIETSWLKKPIFVNNIKIISCGLENSTSFFVNYIERGIYLDKKPEEETENASST